MLVLAYRLSISKTIEVRGEYLAISNESGINKDLPIQLAILKKQEKYYDSLLSKLQINKGSFQQNLLKTITDSAKENKLQITSFIQPHVILQDDLVSKTYQFTVKGTYNDILQLIHHLEQKTKFGEVINVRFKKQKQPRTRKHFLEAEILLKSFG